MWTLRTALLVSLLAFVFAKPFYPWSGNRHLSINRAYQESDSMESNESSISDINDSDSSSESDMSESNESSGSASSEEDFLSTAEPETTSSVTEFPPFFTEEHVPCFTVHTVTEPRGDV